MPRLVFMITALCCGFASYFGAIYLGRWQLSLHPGLVLSKFIPSVLVPSYSDIFAVILFLTGCTAVLGTFFLFFVYVRYQGKIKRNYMYLAVKYISVIAFMCGIGFFAAEKNLDVLISSHERAYEIDEK